MIAFITPTALPIEAATTMGVSVKETDNPADFTDEHRALPLYTPPLNH